MTTGIESRFQNQKVKVGDMITDQGVGTVTTIATTSVEEHGDSISHVTKLTFTNFALGTIVQSTSLGFGAKFYTLPAGSIVIDKATLAGSLQSAGTTKTDTPEVSIGTVIASGAIATMTTGTFENVMDGGAGLAGSDWDAVAPDINGTVFYKHSLSTIAPSIEATGGLARDLFLNVAVAWAGTSNGALTFTGVIILKWRKID